MSKQQNAVEVRNIRKQFSYSRHNNNSLKRAITQIFKKKDKSKDTFYALDGVSFDVKKGDFFGILGRNGSGKSTLLKIISEIYQPTSGAVKHHGKLVSFIELGVGFKPELTGRENVFLNAALLGFSKAETEAMYDDIVEFAELEKFMDQKLKNYSSGMKVRLAFSVAIRAKSDILILDEVLAVGDAAFKKKSSEYFEKLKEDKSKTVILVTHGMEDVKRFCNKAIVIEDGQIIFEGGAEDAASKYRELFVKSKTPAYENENMPKISARIVGKSVLNSSDTLRAEIVYTNTSNAKVTAKAYIDMRGHPIMSTNPRTLNIKGMITEDTKEHVVTYELDLKKFNRGEYKLIVILEDINTQENIATFGTGGELVFKIDNFGARGGILKNEAEMKLIK